MRCSTNIGQSCIVRYVAKKILEKLSPRVCWPRLPFGKFEDEDADVYSRGETAQGIFINYKNVLGSGMYSIPFGIAQVGKAFRNEISPRQFLFRKREFEQMEMQYFVSPSEAPAAYEEWKKKEWLL